jgi:transforming growth factor-beta-induced protein
MRKSSPRILWALVMVLAVGLAGCSSEETSLTAPLADETFNANAAKSSDIVDVAIGAGIFNTLVAAVQAAELEGALRGEGPFTVFAPTDEAFANLPDGLVDQLLEPRNKEKLQELLLYHVVAGQVLAGDLRRFQFTETLQGQYLWIRKLWRGTVKVNNARVISADVLASNGVIHVIDTVLIPRGFELEPEVPTPENDIVDGPLTVFAPTDEAFAKLPPDLVTALLLPENKEKLQELLLYHVVAGRVLAGDLRYFQRVETLEGSKLRIIKWFGNVWVNWSRVTTADVLATNGVIHIIDRVLIPRGFTLETKNSSYDTDGLDGLVTSSEQAEAPPTEFQLEYLERGN